LEKKEGEKKKRKRGSGKGCSANATTTPAAGEKGKGKINRKERGGRWCCAKLLHEPVRPLGKEISSKKKGGKKSRASSCQKKMNRPEFVPMRKRGRKKKKERGNLFVAAGRGISCGRCALKGGRGEARSGEGRRKKRGGGREG